jgi:hypothetical protein
MARLAAAGDGLVVVGGVPSGARLRWVRGGRVADRSMGGQGELRLRWRLPLCPGSWPRCFWGTTALPQRVMGWWW